MTIQDIQCFLKLAETLNFTKTAEDLYISQPAVTRHIHSLEEELGFTLFDRSVRRKIELTEAGKLYYIGLHKCEQLYNDTIERIREENSRKPLIVNLLRGIRFPDRFVSETTRFMQENPSFLHYMNFIDPDHIVASIERGEVMFCPKEYLPANKSYKKYKLTKTPVANCILASKGHAAFRDSLNQELSKEQIAQLQQTTLFLPKDLPVSLRDAYLSYLKEWMGELPEEIMYLDSMDSVILFLRSARCFTICNDWHAETHSTELRAVPIAVASDYYAVWDPESVSNPFFEAYLKRLRKE